MRLVTPRNPVIALLVKARHYELSSYTVLEHVGSLSLEEAARLLGVEGYGRLSRYGEVVVRDQARVASICSALGVKGRPAYLVVRKR